MGGKKFRFISIIFYIRQPLNMTKFMKLSVILFFILAPFLLLSQENTDSISIQKHRYELGINITSTLSNFLGNNNNPSLLSDPYLLGLKYEMKNASYLRTGFNVKVRKVSENFGQRNIREEDYRLRAGWEKRVKMSKRFYINAGIDLVGGYNYSDVTTVDLISGFSTQILSKQLSYGGGPVLGLMIQLNKRISLSTEASLYYQNLQTYRLLFLGFPDPFPLESTVFGYSLLPMIPSSLFILIKF